MLLMTQRHQFQASSLMGAAMGENCNPPGCFSSSASQHFAQTGLVRITVHEQHFVWHGPGLHPVAK